MSEIDDLLKAELKKLPARPRDDSRQAEKKRYSELMSAAAARALGEALRRKGLVGTLPLLDSEPTVPRTDQDAGTNEVNNHGDGEEIVE
jgi:hypothetical protein